VRDLVHSFKYKGLHAAAGWMAAQMPVAWLPGNAVLVPVPLHPSRERERGYNQSELLARAIGTRTGLPVVRALRRVRHTPPQAHQDAAGRWLNIRDAFAPRRELPPGCVAVLVDDVCTTGATLEECAAVLRGMGAERMLGLVFARAGSGGDRAG
jgi:ComF family protein